MKLIEIFMDNDNVKIYRFKHIKKIETRNRCFQQWELIKIMLDKINEIIDTINGGANNDNN